MSARILVVDDTIDLLGAYRDVLEEQGYEVTTASSGDAAVAILKRDRPDLVITDIFLPGIDGLELISRIRGDLAPTTPILAISGVPSVRTDALRRGANAFAVKPIDLDDLMQLTREALKGGSALGAGAPGKKALHEEATERHRRASRSLGEAALESYLDFEPEALRDARQLISLATRFFGVSAAALLQSRRGTMEVVAAADGAVRPVPVPPELLSFAQNVLESASCLVVSVRGSHCAAPELLRTKVRFLACAPVMLGTIPIGVLALYDEAPQPFTGAELGLLELFASRAATFVGRPQQQRMLDRSGLLRPDTYFRALNAMTQLMPSSFSALGVAVARITQDLDVTRAAGITQALPARTLVGRLGQRTLSVFTASTAADVEQHLSQVRARAAFAGPLEGWGQIVLEQLPPISAESLVGWCQRLAYRPETDAALAAGAQLKGVAVRTMSLTP
jgi:DNA-binding response OmpR family regulator